MVRTLSPLSDSLPSSDETNLRLIPRGGTLSPELLNLVGYVINNFLHILTFAPSSPFCLTSLSYWELTSNGQAGT